MFLRLRSGLELRTRTAGRLDTAAEGCAFSDGNAGRRELSFAPRGAPELDPLLGNDAAGHGAGNHDALRGDVGGHVAARLDDDEVAFDVDRAFDAPGDARALTRRQLSLDDD